MIGFFLGFLFLASSKNIDIPPDVFVQLVFPENADTMLDIADCESGKRQFEEDGSPIISPTGDWGYFQINLSTWDTEAQMLGLDYKNDPYENILMARHIFDTQGIDAWVCNKKISMEDEQKLPADIIEDEVEEEITLDDDLLDDGGIEETDEV